jgi:hypothetical protein
MESGCVHVVEVDTTCVGSNGGLFLSRRHVDLICEVVVDEASCDGEVESEEQLVQGLSVAADEHGQAVGSVGGGGDAAHWVDDTDGDLTVVDQVGDVRKGRWIEGDPLTWASLSMVRVRLRCADFG